MCPAPTSKAMDSALNAWDGQGHTRSALRRNVDAWRCDSSGQGDERHGIVGFKADLWLQNRAPECAIEDAAGASSGVVRINAPRLTSSSVTEGVTQSGDW